MYTHAAQSMGANTLHILWFHVLPNVMPVVIVLFTTRVGAVILAEAGLSFLGLGMPPPEPTWGSMLSGGGRTYMYVGPWSIGTGLALAVVVYAINVYRDVKRVVKNERTMIRFLRRLCYSVWSLPGQGSRLWRLILAGERHSVAFNVNFLIGLGRATTITEAASSCL